MTEDGAGGGGLLLQESTLRAHRPLEAAHCRVVPGTVLRVSTRNCTPSIVVMGYQ